jgi:hypothetical protein
MAAAKRMSAFFVVVLSLVLISFAGYLLALFVPPLREMFGEQGGAMVQLATSHVPTMEDVDEMEEEREQMRKEIVDMTGYW